MHLLSHCLCHACVTEPRTRSVISRKLWSITSPEDEAYKSFYTVADYPIYKVLQEPVYVQVHILERTDPNIVLNLEKCWATADPSAASLPQWDLLVDG